MSTLLWEASRTFRSCCRVSGVYEVPDCVNHRKETGMLAGPRCVRIFNSMDNKTNLPCHCSPLPLLLGIPLPLLSLATALPCHYSRPIFLPFLFSPLPLLSLATTPGYSRGPHKSDPSVRLANKMAHPSAHVQAEVDHHSLVTILSALYAQDQRFASRTPRRSGHSLRICSKKCQP